MANEWQSFTLAAPSRVRYGAENTWLLVDLPAGLASCSNSFFGRDPLPGIVKHCEVLAAAAADGCGGALSLPGVPAGSINVRDHGAAGDGVRDDTAAIQHALNALRPGQWLVFPAGVYKHSASLAVGRPDVVIDGRGATLHAVNPWDQALLIQASGVRVQGFVMTAVTEARLSAPWQSRIAIWRHGVGLAPLERIEIIGNRIIEGDGPGTPLANSASAAGIYVHNARDFLVAGNTVRRSLSDGIHVTGGSRRGQIVFNTVRETGDDMIGIVSYLSETGVLPTPAQAAASLAALRETNLVQDMLIADNNIAGQYWGRGIAVVGGEHIGVLRNQIDATTHAAAVYLAREPGYGSLGVRDVRVEGNLITRVQTTRPAYEVEGVPDFQTGHGAVELVAHQYDDEAVFPALRDEFVVRGVRVAGNRIDQSASESTRVGYGFGLHDYDLREDGTQRWYSGARVSEVMLEANHSTAVLDALVVFNQADPALVLSCSGNTLEGRAYNHAACGSSAISVAGSSKTSCAGVR